MCSFLFDHQNKESALLSRKQILQIKRIFKTMLRSCVFALVVFAPLLWAEGVSVTGGNDFADIYGRLVGWIKGDLGRTLSIAFVLIGLAYGMARQSLIGFATGVGAAVGLQVTPTVINSIFGL